MASILKVDEMQGVSNTNEMTIAANNVTITDGTATMKMQVGLAKVYTQINQDGTQNVVGSFSVSSITDLSVGRTTVAHSNNFSDATYTSVASAAKDFDSTPSGNQAEMAACTYTETSQSHYNSNTDSGNANDGQLFLSIFGDLA